MDDQDNIDGTNTLDGADTLVSYDYITSKATLLETITIALTQRQGLSLAR